jgi:predicted RNA-binding Zn-ribbon protein involved in translation (DUF1610 family)
MKTETNKAPALRCEAMVSLIPCPFCGTKPRDLGHGISCPKCGLWLGDGSQARENGGYRKTWNTRQANIQRKLERDNTNLREVLSRLDRYLSGVVIYEHGIMEGNGDDNSLTPAKLVRSVLANIQR